MSVEKRIIQDNIEKVKVDELLADEYEQAGYGGITLTKTPLGTQINLFAMRPGRVIGKRGKAIKDASSRLENELGLENPQITVVEVEFPELDPRIMAARIANALERGVHYRRALFWSLNMTIEAGAIGCEIVIRGPLRSNRARYEKVSEGYVPKSGEPALRYVKKAVMHVKQKKGVLGINVSIVPPDAKFPDKVKLDSLPVIEYPDEEYELPAGMELEPSTAVEPAQQVIKPITGPTGAEKAPKTYPFVEEPTPVEPENAVEPQIEGIEESTESILIPEAESQIPLDIEETEGKIEAKVEVASDEAEKDAKVQETKKPQDVSDGDSEEE
jgi:small subunit ribosomal protein S3